MFSTEFSDTVPFRNKIKFKDIYISRGELPHSFISLFLSVLFEKRVAFFSNQIAFKKSALFANYMFSVHYLVISLSLFWMTWHIGSSLLFIEMQKKKKKNVNRFIICLFLGRLPFSHHLPGWVNTVKLDQQDVKIISQTSINVIKKNNI